MLVNSDTSLNICFNTINQSINWTTFTHELPMNSPHYIFIIRILWAFNISHFCNIQLLFHIFCITVSIFSTLFNITDNVNLLCDNDLFQIYYVHFSQHICPYFKHTFLLCTVHMTCIIYYILTDILCRPLISQCCPKYF